MSLRRIVVLVISITMLSADGMVASTVHKTKALGEPRPDRALVYVIREKAFVGGGVGMFVFADDQLVAFVRNNTYSFGYVEPGPRLIWGDAPSGLEMHFVAGETYYIEARPVNPISMLTEAEGKKAIETVGAYIESDQTDLDNAAKKIAKRYEKAQRREAKKEKAAVEEVAAMVPAQTEGTVKLASNTKIAIELMENLSSSLSSMGETIWFRVAEDVRAGEVVLIPRDSPVKATVRQAKAGSSFGEQGTLDVALVSIDLDERTRVPLVGQLAAAGDERTAGMMTGLVAGAFIKGTEAFHPAGTKFAAWTRDEVWLSPAAPPTAEPGPPGIPAPSRDFVFGANTRRDPAPIDLSFPCSADVSEAAIVGAGDWTLPVPVAAAGITRQGGTCTARFAGWGVMRHVRPGEAPQTLRLRARSGETQLHLNVPARIRLE